MERPREGARITLTLLDDLYGRLANQLGEDVASQIINASGLPYVVVRGNGRFLMQRQLMLRRGRTSTRMRYRLRLRGETTQSVRRSQFPRIWDNENGTYYIRRVPMPGRRYLVWVHQGRGAYRLQYIHPRGHDIKRPRQIENARR